MLDYRLLWFVTFENVSPSFWISVSVSESQSFFASQMLLSDPLCNVGLHGFHCYMWVSFTLYFLTPLIFHNHLLAWWDYWKWTIRTTLYSDLFSTLKNDIYHVWIKMISPNVRYRFCWFATIRYTSIFCIIKQHTWWRPTQWKDCCLCVEWLSPMQNKPCIKDTG